MSGQDDAVQPSVVKPLRVYIVAGEASGDALGASLISALHQKRPDVQLRGVGGARMQAAGLESLFPMHELSVMGVVEVLPKLFSILSRMRQTVRDIITFDPDVLVTIDSPDFCFRVVKKVKAKSSKIRCMHYVAPSVWAWREGRAKKISEFLDHLLALLPFEPPYFEKYGLETTFVGHPVVERKQRRGDGARFRSVHGLKPGQPILTMLPGSRMSELSRLLPKFAETAEIVLRNRHQAVIVIPTLRFLKKHIEEFFKGRGINPILIYEEDEKFDAFAASSAAIAASGTVTLELALTDTPHIIAYKLSPVSAWLARHLIKTPYVNLVNIILKREAVPELLLENCEPKPMAQALVRLIDNKDARNRQMSDFREALLALGLGDPETPGMKAADAVLKVAQT